MANPDLLSELKIDRSRQPEPPRRWPWILALLATLAIALGIGGLYLYRSRTAPVEVTTTVVKAASTAGQTGSTVLDASGYVTARRQATVSARITGKVLEVLIEEGMRVEEGQVIARLEPVDAAAQLALSASELTASQSAVDEIQARLTLAERELGRMNELSDRGLVARAQVDTARAERSALAARLANARDRIGVARASQKLASIGVDNTVVRAPFAGVVIAKAAQPGEMISPLSAGGGFTRTGIGTIVDMDSLEVQVDVAESFIGLVEPKQPVEIVLNAYPDWKIPGSVIAIIPTADRSKATVKVRIAFGERDDRIVPDMGARVAFLAAPSATTTAPAAPMGVRIPSTAVVDGAVFVVRDGLVSRRPVDAVSGPAGELRVRSGLAAGEVIVTAPPPDLPDGAAVIER